MSGEAWDDPVGRVNGHCSSRSAADRPYLGFVGRVTWRDQCPSLREAGTGELSPKPGSVEGGVYQETLGHWKM